MAAMIRAVWFRNTLGLTRKVYNNLYMTFFLRVVKGTSNNSHSVTPAQAGVQEFQHIMDSRFRGNDIFRGTLKMVLGLMVGFGVNV